MDRVAYSEEDGTYRLLNVPAGPVTVSVTFTGYNTAPQPVVVEAGQTATLNFGEQRFYIATDFSGITDWIVDVFAKCGENLLALFERESE